MVEGHGLAHSGKEAEGAAGNADRGRHGPGVLEVARSEGDAQGHAVMPRQDARRILAGGGNDRAGAGDDYVDADDGNDTVGGGTGNDDLAGGASADTLTGGAGNDVFVVTSGDLITVLADAVGDGCRHDGSSVRYI